MAVGFDGDGVQAGIASYEITGKRIVLGNIDLGPEAGGNETGMDNRGQGLGAALLNAMEELYPDCWFAEIGEDHSPEGVMFMEGRALSGRRRIHSSTCAAEVKNDDVFPIPKAESPSSLHQQLIDFIDFLVHG